MFVWFLSFLKSKSENYWQFHNPHEQGFQDMLNGASGIFHKPEKWQKQVVFYYYCIFGSLKFRAVTPSTDSLITRSNHHLWGWSWTIFNSELIELQDKVFSFICKCVERSIYYKMCSISYDAFFSGRSVCSDVQMSQLFKN